MRRTFTRPAASSAPGVRVPPWLADDYLDSYMCWREAYAAARLAYEYCDAVECPDRAAAFAAYGAALDREEHAALLLEARVQRLRQWVA